MVLTNKRSAGRRETETVTTDAAVIPNVVSTHAVDVQPRQWRVFLSVWNQTYSKNDIKVMFSHHT